MSERIIAIREVDGFRFTPTKEGYEQSFEGFEVETDAQTIRVLVADQSSCCESWGHVSSVDDLQTFVGATLLNISRTDEKLVTKDWPEYGLDEGGTVLVNFDTDRGRLQLAVYNAHNGYYGHTAIIDSTQLQIEEVL